jgi:Lrp/AsnC family leucine-responsive transcriptional regulator
MKPIDATDLRILNLLQEDAKFTNKEISTKLGLSITPVYERIKKLEERGYITAYRAIVDKYKLGYQLTAFCNVRLKEHTTVYLRQFENQVQELPEVMECYHIAGMYDYLLKVVIFDMRDYQHFISDKLASLPNIGHVQSAFVMSEIKHSTVLALGGPRG